MFQVVDRISGKLKYVGRSKAVVTDNRDPFFKGRIQVNHPQLGETVWIPYLKGPGQFDVPSIGDIVYVEAETGEYTHPIASGCIPKGSDFNINIPTTFKRAIPTNRGLYSPNGHLIELDDGVATLSQAPIDNNFTTQYRGVRITSKAGNKIHILEDQSKILIDDVNGNQISLDYANNQVTIFSTGKIVQTAQSDLNITVGGVATINVTGAATITAGGDCTITAPTIKLNGMAGNVLTTTSEPVTDLIFGTPTTGVSSVKAG